MQGDFISHPEARLHLKTNVCSLVLHHTVTVRDAQHRSVHDATLGQSHIHVCEGPAWHIHGLNASVSIPGSKLDLCTGPHCQQSVCGVKVLLEPPTTWSPDSKEQTPSGTFGHHWCWTRGLGSAVHLLRAAGEIWLVVPVALLQDGPVRQAELRHLMIQAPHLGLPPLYGGKNLVLVQGLWRSSRGVMQHLQDLILAQLAGLPHYGLGLGAQGSFRPAAVHRRLRRHGCPLDAACVACRVQGGSASTLGGLRPC